MKLDHKMLTDPMIPSNLPSTEHDASFTRPRIPSIIIALTILAAQSEQPL